MDTKDGVSGATQNACVISVKRDLISVKRGLIPMDTKDGVSGAAHHDARHTSVKRDLH